MSGRLRRHIRHNVVGYIALFCFAIGGTAYATHPGGVNTISSGDIINGQVTQPDLAADSVNGLRIVDGSVRSAEVADAGGGSLTGVDINESTLVGVNAEQVDGGDLCRTNGTLVMQEDTPDVTICNSGSLSVIATCGNPDNAVGELLLDTSANDAFLTSGDEDDEDFEAAEAPKFLARVSSGSGANAFTGDTSFAAGNPDGSQLAGSVTMRTTALGGNDATCEFVVGAMD